MVDTGPRRRGKGQGRMEIMLVYSDESGGWKLFT